VQRNREYQTGLGIWQTVLDRRPHARAHEHLAMFLRDAGNIDQAIVHLQIAAPDSPNSRHALASILLDRGDIAGSVREFGEFVRRRPNDPHIIEAREEYALALIRANDARGAAEQFQAIVGLLPGYARGHVGLADAWLRLGDRAAAKAEYQEAVRLQPDNVVALVNLGLLQAAGGESDEAVATLRHALAIEPRALPPRRQLLEIFLTRRQFPELEREARGLLTYAPNDAEAHNLLGVALASQERYAPAIEQFTEAVRLDPGNTGARDNLAHAGQALRLQSRR
jgi:Flp pilus assembly protein TadD